MKTNWRAWGEVTAVLSVVVSLLFVGYELRLSRTVALNDSYGVSAEISITANALISSHGSIWQRGCLDEELSNEEYAIFMRLVSAVDRVNFAQFYRATQGVSPAPPDTFPKKIALTMKAFPGFEKGWRIIESDIRTALSESQWLLAVNTEFENLKNNGSDSIPDQSVCMYL